MEDNAICLSCNANWWDGEFGAGCEVCGGGAMERPCPICLGLCGCYWSRAVLDSNDFRLAHWRGDCKYPGRLEGAARYYDAGVAASWWLDGSALPTQVWACLIGAVEGKAVVLDMDGQDHRFARYADAYEWLREDEYDTLTDLRFAAEVGSDVKPPPAMIGRACRLLQDVWT